MFAHHSSPIVYPDAASLGAALAAQIAGLVADAFAAGRSFVLGCPSGRTPTAAYEALGREFARRGTDLSRLVIAMMDEFVLPAGGGWRWADPAEHYSCRGFAERSIRAVFDRGLPRERRLPAAAIWAPDPRDPGAYDQRLRDAGGVDFFLLAMGASDGHIAFNPAGSALVSISRVVALAEQTRRDNLGTFPGFASLADVPTHGVTVGLATIAGLSHRAAMVVTGGHKRAALERLLDSDGYDPSWPATVIRTMPQADLLVDAAAFGAP